MAYIKIGDVSRILGVDIQTVRSWADSGKLECFKTPSGHRRFDKNYIERFLNGDYLENKNLTTTSSNQKSIVIYARVSTRKQADAGNLDRQISRLTQYAITNGFHIEGIYKEIASGINENRRQLLKLLDKVQKQKNLTVLVEYKDRLARFGFEYLKKYIEDSGSHLMILDAEEKDEERELVEDLIAITTSFSARIYGKRGGKKVVDKVETIIRDGEKDETDETT